MFSPLASIGLLTVLALQAFCLVSFPLQKDINHTLILSSLESEAVKEYAQLAYTDKSWKVFPVAGDDIDYTQTYCIGLKSIPAARCINYKRITPDADIWIYVDENDDIQQISVSSSDGDKVKTGPRLSVKRASRGAVPKANQKTVKTVEDGTTTFEEKEEEADDKSFVQKYWMYMVPPLVMFLIVTDSGSRQ